MADISAELAAIKSAVYGEEVRGSIHDAIERINDEVDMAIQTQLASTVSGATYTLNGINFTFRKVGYLVSVTTSGNPTNTITTGGLVEDSIQVAPAYYPLADTLINVQATDSIAMQFRISETGLLQIGYPGAAISVNANVRMTVMYVSATATGDDDSLTIAGETYTINGITFVFRKIGQLVNVITSGTPTTAFNTGTYTGGTVTVHERYRPMAGTVLNVQATNQTAMQFNLSYDKELQIGYPGATIDTSTPIRMSVTYVAADSGGSGTAVTGKTYKLNGIDFIVRKVGHIVNVVISGTPGTQIETGSYVDGQIRLDSAFWPLAGMVSYIQATNQIDMQVNLASNGVLKIGYPGSAIATTVAVRTSFTYVAGSWNEVSSYYYVDEALSSTSENPVQNRTITTALSSVNTEITGLKRDVINSTNAYTINGVTFIFRRCGYFVNVVTAGLTTEDMSIEQYTGGSVRVASIYRPVEDTVLNVQATASTAVQFYLSADGELKLGWPGAQIPAGTSIRMNVMYVSAAITSDTSSIFARSYTINGVTFVFRRIGRLVNVITRGSTTSAMETGVYTGATVQVADEFIPVDNTIQRDVILYEQATVLTSLQFNLSGTGQLKMGYPSQIIPANTAIRMNVTYVGSGGDAIDNARTYMVNGLSFIFRKIGDLINVQVLGETTEQMEPGSYSSRTASTDIAFWPVRATPLYLQATSTGDVQVNLSEDGIVKIGQPSITMPAGTTIRLSFTYVSADWGQGNITSELKQALINCFAHVSWDDTHGRQYYNALVSALNA